MRLLVVDSYRDCADSLAVLLTMWGHEVKACYNGPDALRETAALKPDAIIAEITLPGIDGFELAARLRNEGCPAVLIALTGWGGNDIAQRVLRAGFAHFLIKAADTAELRDVLNRVQPASPQPACD